MGKKSRQKRLRGNPDPLAATMADHSRTRMKELWERAKLGALEDPEERSLAAAMREHPEFHHIWEKADTLTDPDFEVNGMNPFLHVQMHSVVTNQRQLLPDVEAAIQRLCAAGLSEHEAEHQIANLVAQLLFTMFRDKVPFDEAAYLAKVRALRA